MSKPNHKIIGKIIIAASFKNISPFVIGKGKSLSEDTDGDVITDGNGNPYLPASSFAGKLKTFIKTGLKPTQKNLSEYFWGTENSSSQANGQEYQSHLNLEDIRTFDDVAKSKIKIRDGVKIDPKTAMAEPGAKYDYQIVEPGLTFYLRAEVTIRENAVLAEVTESINQIYTALKHPDFRIGALTNHGFGKIAELKIQVWHFNFDGKKHTPDWFNYLTKLQSKKTIDKEYYGIVPAGDFAINLKETSLSSNETFCIKAKFNLKNTLLIGTYGTAAKDADKKHLQSGGKHVITGKSIRGALRKRAERIVHTLNGNAEIVKILFGDVDENDKAKTKKGKLRIEETVLEDSRSFEQNRTRIDRFTGGVQNGALFNAEPIATNEEIQLQFTITNNAKAEEKGLLLLLLKDLWTEDLAIGGEKNIGRGVFKGISATIKDQGIDTTVSQNGIPKEKIAQFNKYAEALVIK